MTPAFARHIGIDYSGAETPTSGLKGLRVYLAEGGAPPLEVLPPPSNKNYWTRRGLAEWLVARLSENVPTLVGIDHGFSFPLRYFEVHGLLPDWPRFLDDFQRHWPTDEDHVYVDFVRDGIAGNGARRMGNARWRRLTEERAGGAKSVFHFDVQGQVAKSKYEVIQLAVQDATDHAGQLAQVESVIQRGADYMMLGATEYKSAIPGLRKLKAAKIATVVYNFLEPHEDESAKAMQYISFDHAEGGKMAGKWSAEKLNGKGKIAILQGVPGVVSDQRMNGFLSVVKQHPGIQVVIGVHTDFDRLKAFDATKNLLAAHPDLNLIYGVSTAVGLGIGQALQAAGKSKSIYSLGFGGTGDEIKAMKEGWLSASPLRSIDDSGVAVADAFVAHMKGEKVAQVWSGPFVMVDAWTDASAVIAHSNRYSRPLMGR